MNCLLLVSSRCVAGPLLDMSSTGSLPRLYPDVLFLERHPYPMIFVVTLKLILPNKLSKSSRLDRFKVESTFPFPSRSSKISRPSPNVRDSNRATPSQRRNPTPHRRPWPTPSSLDLPYKTTTTMPDVEVGEDTPLLKKDVALQEMKAESLKERAVATTAAVSCTSKNDPLSGCSQR